MLEKIKKLLGEELSKQVAEKLKEADIELAVMNDGSVVPADKHDVLKTEHKALETKYKDDIADVNGKLDKLSKEAGDIDSLKASIDTLKTENEKSAADHIIAMENVKKNSVLEVALTKANIKENAKDKNAYLEMVKKTIDLSKLDFDGDSLKGLDELIKDRQEQFPELFGEIKKTGTQQNGIKTNPPVGNKADLIKAYNEAEKLGKISTMMQIQKQIKELPKE